MTPKKMKFMLDVTARLNRCEGHMRAVGRMVQEGRSCESLFVQLAAIRSAVSEISLKVLDNHLDECVSSGKSSAAELRTITKLMLSGKA